jgi:hypothetical protein
VAPSAYEYEHDKAPIDILYGSAELRERLDRVKARPRFAPGGRTR